MTNITIDIGNTLIKYAIFSDNKLLSENIIRDENFELLTQSLLKYRVQYGIISNVGKCNKLIYDILQTYNIEIVTFSHDTLLPFKNDYSTPKTLGLDRVAALVGVYSIKPNGNFLVIDLGTCITYDILYNNHFLGGNIAPGIEMRAKAMHQFTSNLPNIDVTQTTQRLGKSTKEALNCGVYYGVIYEIKSIIERYRKEYPEIEVYVTGRGSNLIYKELNNELGNINQELHLVFKGLNYLITSKINR